MHHINRIMDNKIHMIIISKDAEKSFDKTNTLYNTFNKIGIEGSFSNLIKCIYEKPTANKVQSVIVEDWEFFTPRSEPDKDIFSLLLFRIYWRVLLGKLGKKKKQKGVPTEIKK